MAAPCRNCGVAATDRCFGPVFWPDVSLGVLPSRCNIATAPLMSDDLIPVVPDHEPPAALAAAEPAAIPVIVPEVPAGLLPLVPGESAKYRLPNVHPEGLKFVAISGGLVLIAALVLGWSWLAWPLLGITLWVAAFFRDPVRVTPLDENAIVSPADGLVSLITVVDMPRQLVGEGGLADAGVAARALRDSVTPRT